MKKCDLKSMNDDKFIELVKKHLPKNIIDKIYEDKLCRKDKKTYKAVIITLGLIMGIIPLGVIEELFKKEISLDVTTITIIGSMILSYVICNKSRKKEAKVKQEKFNYKLIELKHNIENLSDEEFNILVNCYDYINNYEVPNELFDCPNVLEIADKLLEINAVNLLKEFEILENINDIQNSYSDLNINKDKVYKKSN